MQVPVPKSAYRQFCQPPTSLRRSAAAPQSQETPPWPSPPTRLLPPCLHTSLPASLQHKGRRTDTHSALLLAAFRLLRTRSLPLVWRMHVKKERPAKARQWPPLPCWDMFMANLPCNTGGWPCNTRGRPPLALQATCTLTRRHSHSQPSCLPPLLPEPIQWPYRYGDTKAMGPCWVHSRNWAHYSTAGGQLW